MDDVRQVDGAQFLETIEAVYRREGLTGVAEHVGREFAIGVLVGASAGGSATVTYRICDRAVWRMDEQGTVSADPVLAPSRAPAASCVLIRVFALSYVADPFQVELYGEAQVS